MHAVVICLPPVGKNLKYSKKKDILSYISKTIEGI